MRVAIFYHIPERELSNAYLLKAELNRRGHDVYLYYYNHIKESNEILNYRPDIVLAHGLRNDAIVKDYTDIFNKKVDRIINLQYEQVLNNIWHISKHHIPKGLAKNAIHLCWGEENKRVLIENGVPSENTIIVGSLTIDLSRKEFNSIYKTKEEMSKTYNIPVNKKWILFISNFTFGNFSIEYLAKNMFPRLGKENSMRFHNISKISQDEVTRWIEEYLKDNDCEFIYKIHAGEFIPQSLKDLSKNYNNFHLVSRDSIKNWINSSNKINTWMSTSIVECYFMNKQCSILRPVYVPEDIDSEIMINSKNIKDYKEFVEYNNSSSINQDFPIKKDTILKYYDFDSNKFAYEKVCDLLEELVNKNKVMDLYKEGYNLKSNREV